MATASELIINKAKWNSLPPDLKAIVENACAACNVISEAWCQKNNAEAMEDLVKNQGVIAQPLPDDVVKALRVATTKILDEAVAKDPVTKKVHDSYMAYKAKYDAWADLANRLPHQDPQGADEWWLHERLAGGIDTFIDLVGRATSWLALGIALVMGANVLLRYAFSIGSIWAQELEWHIMVPICVFGMSYALLHGEHVRVDVVFQYFSPRNKLLVDVVTSIAGMLLSVLVIYL